MLEVIGALNHVTRLFHSHDTFAFSPHRALMQRLQPVSGVSRFPRTTSSAEVRTGKKKKTKLTARTYKYNNKHRFTVSENVCF